MTDFVEFAFDDGTLLALQVFAPLPAALAGTEGETDDEGAVPGFGTSRPVARGGRVMAATEGALGTLLAPLVPLLQRVHDTVATVPDAPDELSVSFGLRVSQDLKLGVVGATGEATMVITANWHLASPAAPAPAVADVDSAAGSATGVRAG
ncbi:CU044_2847 family protein [Streptomyces aurantiacus]|uniref:Trypsin-co-occurring domain-containing protein n=1 Tax=Streptomyces aurantiacus JA 4570 TaxID=1286094 RepID=S4AUK8_9ACTN|nr:CU044_2847 family protein [Streptomyces aurantiacus]EPH45102.1 hypothetical protein STRAU_1730 [Streptomyces aurantiacus JA 4570]